MLNRRDPRRPPKQPQPEKVPEPVQHDKPSSSSKFKIPKKKKEEVIEKPVEKVIEKVIEEPIPEVESEDSEPELKIAESDHEDDKKEDQEKDKNEENKEEKDKGQLTKEMLQNIVASIDTKEASKLLERATRLLNSEDGNHKLSLKQLLVGDSDSEEENTEVKKPSKKSQPASKPKKPAKLPTPGTRRSRRLQVPENEEIQENPGKTEENLDKTDENSDDENQLVIDESPNESESVAKKTRGRPRKDSIKKEEDLEDILTPKTRMQNSRMGPKSKTWFPDSRGPLQKSKNSPNLKSPPRIPEVKREPKEPDLKVFALNSVISDDFLSGQLQEKISNIQVTKFEKLSDLMGKVQDLDKEETIEQVKKTNKVEIVENNQLEQVLKLELPEIFVTEIAEKNPVQDHLNKAQEIDNEDELIELVDVIKNLSKNQDLIEDLSKKELKNLETKTHLSEYLPNLFKCMNCFFQSDSAQEFKTHLFEKHSTDKKKNRHGWLKCTYCLKKLANPDFLVNHIIRDHAQVYHCPHCHFRSNHQGSLLVHQHLSHPDLEIGFVQGAHLEQIEKLPKLPPYSASISKGFNCQEPKCDFKTGTPQELGDHLFLDHGNPDLYQDFQCPHCLVGFQKAWRLFLHLKVAHAKKNSLMIMRRIQPSMTLDDESESEPDEVTEIPEDDGLEGDHLFRCGNSDCTFRYFSVNF